MRRNESRTSQLSLSVGALLAGGSPPPRTGSFRLRMSLAYYDRHVSRSIIAAGAVR